jgi:hypothetical protein
MTTGKLKKVRDAIAWQGNDKFTWTAFDVGPDGKDARKTMEIVYTRKAAGGAGASRGAGEGCGCDDGCGCGCGCD